MFSNKKHVYDNYYRIPQLPTPYREKRGRSENHIHIYNFNIRDFNIRGSSTGCFIHVTSKLATV